MPHDYPSWSAIYQQMQRWMRAGFFERLVGDTRILLCEFAGHKGQPTAACIDSRTLQSTPASGARAGYDGAKRRKGPKVHIAVDTLGHLLALRVPPADRAIAPRSRRWPKTCSRSPEAQSKWLMAIRTHWAERGEGCPEPRHPAQSGQTSHGETRLRAAANVSLAL
jgi:hypothetical protein